MLDKTLSSQNQSQFILKKSSSTKNCSNLLCLKSLCNEEESKQKQKTLNYQYFQKLSLKKFNQTSFLNQSYYQKQKHENHKELKRDKSTQEIEFQNIVLYSPQQHYLANNSQKLHFPPYSQTKRIHRSSSHRALDRPQLKTTDRSIQKELEADKRRIQEFQKLRNKLQTQIYQLDHSIDKYYTIYHSKLDELRKINAKIVEIDQSQKTMAKVPSLDQLKSFKKKPYHENHNGQGYQNTNVGFQENQFYKGNQIHYSSGNIFNHVKKST